METEDGMTSKKGRTTMTDRDAALRLITEHIEREVERIGTYHGDPTATPGGTGYCIPAAVATQIVEKYLAAAPAAEAAPRYQIPPEDDERWQAGYQAAEAEAARTAPTALDVERLAQILKKGNIGCEAHGQTGGAYHLASDHREDAEFIAAEYARLRKGASE